MASLKLQVINKMEIPNIVNRGDDFWEISIQITLEELLDSRKMLEKLGDIKKYISKAENISIGLLHYDDIPNRRQLNNVMQVTVRLRLLPVEKKDPCVYIIEKADSNGVSYPDMKAVLDLYPLDSRGQEITAEKVLSVINQAGVSEKLVNPALIEQKIQRVIRTQCAVKNALVAVGSLPECGEDAKLECFFPVISSSEEGVTRYQSRHVKKGVLICKKTPPQMGKKAGINVRGGAIAPRTGKDIKLVCQKGVCLSSNNLEAYAEGDGLVSIKYAERAGEHQNAEEKSPTEVVLKVSPLMKIEGNDNVTLTTSSSVHVEGDLQTGSKITTDGEIHVCGSVHEGSVLQSLDDITVEGSIVKAELSTDLNIHAQGDVSHSKLVAKKGVIITGKVENTQVIAGEVSAHRVSGCKIVARNSLSVDYLDDDDNKMASTITIGAQDFLRSRFEENQEFLSIACQNLERIVGVIGEPFASRITQSNIQQQWGKFCNRIHSEKKLFSSNQLLDLRTLFQNIPMLKSLVNERNQENRRIEQQLAIAGEENATIEVRKRVGRDQTVTINGSPVALEASDHGVRIDSKSIDSEHGDEQNASLNANKSSP